MIYSMETKEFTQNTVWFCYDWIQKKAISCLCHGKNPDNSIRFQAIDTTATGWTFLALSQKDAEREFFSSILECQNEAILTLVRKHYADAVPLFVVAVNAAVLL